MAKWSGQATVAIRKKIGETSERIFMVLYKSYGVHCKMAKIGLNANLMWLGFLNETKISRGWMHPMDAVKDMKEVIKEELREKRKELSNEELNTLLYPILRDFFNFVFDQARMCNFEPPSSYKELYNSLNR